MMNKNQQTCNTIRSFWNALTDGAKKMVEETDFQVMDSLFGGMTAGEINDLAEEVEKLEGEEA